MTLENISLSELIIQIPTEAAAISFAQQHGLLPIAKICSCGADMRLRTRSDGKNKGTYFQCPLKNCRKEISIRKNSFFENSHLPIRTIILLIYKFSRGEVDNDNLSHELKINSRQTLVDWLSFIREVCIIHFVNNPVLLGGQDSIVEIDECYLVKRKYHIGHLVRECWILGMHDNNLGYGNFIHILDKTQETLEEAILQHVLPGTTIYTDGHAGYNRLNDLGYVHHVVIHKENFVDPITGACTNHIESVWQKLKQVHKARYGTHRSTLHSHLSEFMWRQRYKKSFKKIIDHIKEIYLLNN